MSFPCSRPGCTNVAIAQVTFSYSQSEVEMAPVGHELDPSGYVLCQVHMTRFKPPRGWTLTTRGIPAKNPYRPAPAPVPNSGEAIEALAAEIRRVGGLGEGEPEGTEYSLSSRTNLVIMASRAHLRVVADSQGHSSR